MLKSDEPIGERNVVDRMAYRQPLLDRLRGAELDLNTEGNVLKPHIELHLDKSADRSGSTKAAIPCEGQLGATLDLLIKSNWAGQGVAVDVFCRRRHCEIHWGCPEEAVSVKHPWNISSAGIPARFTRADFSINSAREESLRYVCEYRPIRAGASSLVGCCSNQLNDIECQCQLPYVSVSAATPSTKRSFLMSTSSLERTTELAPEVAKFLATPLHKSFVGGRWVEAADGQTFDVLDPGSGEKIATVTSLKKADVDKAVDSALDAFHNSGWAKMQVAERAACLHRIADAVEARIAEFATIEALDCGKIYEQAVSDVQNFIDTFRYFADLSQAVNYRQVIAVRIMKRGFPVSRGDPADSSFHGISHSFSLDGTRAGSGRRKHLRVEASRRYSAVSSLPVPHGSGTGSASGRRAERRDGSRRNRRCGRVAEPKVQANELHGFAGSRPTRRGSGRTKSDPCEVRARRQRRGRDFQRCRHSGDRSETGERDHVPYRSGLLRRHSLADPARHL